MVNILINLMKDFISLGYIVTCMLILLLLMLYTIENFARKKPFGIIKSLLMTIFICGVLLFVGYWLECLLRV